MTLYSKNGSIPYPFKDGTDGWIEVEEAPVAGEGEEVVWWFPPGWVVRPIQPVKEGYTYTWSQSEVKWLEHEIPPVVDDSSQEQSPDPTQTLTTTQISGLE